MRTFAGIGLMVAGFLQGHAAPPSQGGFSGPTLAIYLVADGMSRDSLQQGTTTPAGLSLKAQPILADADFVAWDTARHSFVITADAAKRVAGECTWREVPFVLVSRGEPVYVGLFGTAVSSRSASVPVILTDGIVNACFMGYTNVPLDVLQMIGRADPGVTERLMALTNATTNVTLRIDRRCPSSEAWDKEPLEPSQVFRGYTRPGSLGAGPYEDPRDDQRILAAVGELFRGKDK